MLTIGEFSAICKVSAKTLRYYAEIGLILPELINRETGYRYYSMNQLETMLIIQRLKNYGFSLEQIKALIQSENNFSDQLYLALSQRKLEMEKQIQAMNGTLDQLDHDLVILKEGKSILSYLEDIEVQLTEVPEMNLLSIRKLVQQADFPAAYEDCFAALFRKIEQDQLTCAAAPMVLFHSDEFSPCGMDTEFAIPIKERVTGTRAFLPGLCLKSVLTGSYDNLPSVYARQSDWINQEGYESKDALFEVYVNDPSQVESYDELITEVYLPIRKKENVLNRKENAYYDKSGAV